jgi:aspartate kinase
MNADHFENASLLNQISYRGSIELASMAPQLYTPKTLQPYKGDSFICKIIYKLLLKGTSEGVALNRFTFVLS